MHVLERVRWCEVVLGLLLATLCATSLSPSYAEERAVLARIGDRVITRAEFEHELERRAGGRPGQYASLEERQNLLEAMIRHELQVEAAKRAGLQESPDVVLAVERLLAGTFVQRTLESRVSDIEVTEEEIRSYYELRAEELATPERRLGAWIQIRKSALETAESARRSASRAEAALAAARSLSPEIRGFGDVARRLSDDRATRYTGGAMGWIREGRPSRWPRVVVEALFRLSKSGEISPLVEDAEGRYLIRLIDVREAGLPPLAEMATSLRHQLLKAKQRAATEAFYENLTQEIGVERDDELFAEVAPPPIARPPRVPGSEGAEEKGRNE